MAWVLAIAFLLAGLAGAVLPFLPGPPLILFGALIHKLLLPQVMRVPTLVALTALTAAAALAEAALAWAGARWAGVGRWGLLGGTVGAVAGICFGGLGLIPGAVLGAALAEWWLARRTPLEAVKAALGGGAALLAGRVAQSAIALLMAALVLLDWFAY